MFKKIIDAISHEVIARKEAEIRKALDVAFRAGWSADELHRRCVFVRNHGAETEILRIDGKDAIYFGPVKFEALPTESGWAVNITQRIERMLQFKKPDEK